ncbi:MAG: hypothetical protein AAF215_06720 [Cyanobacteria bacterium P01_A01_bin.123]
MGRVPAGVQKPERLTVRHQTKGDASANTNITLDAKKEAKFDPMICQQLQLLAFFYHKG